MPVKTMNIAGMNNRNIMNNANIINNSVIINIGMTSDSCAYCHKYNSTQLSKFSLNV
jgi:hypothetical protein